MEELNGQKVKVVLNSSTGFIIFVGTVIRGLENFLLIDSSIGPIYIAYSAIKTIQVVGDQNEKK